MTHSSTKIHAFIIKNNCIYQNVLFYYTLKECEIKADKRSIPLKKEIYSLYVHLNFVNL